MIAFFWSNFSFSEDKRLAQKSFREILDQYVLIGDLIPKEEVRNIPSTEPFWRYPIPVPKISFDYEYMPPPGVAMDKYLPLTIGSGRAIEHMNIGRIFFLEGDYKEASSTWLSGIARFGKEYKYHRRNDFFVSLSFFKQSEAIKDPEIVKNKINNAATFVSKAFQLKSTLEDPALDKYTAKFLYVLAAIYFNYERYAGAYNVADEGLELQRKLGKLDYVARFHRILGESFVRNRSYLQAIQEYDLALRKGPISKKDAAAIFARIADIYFDLNNFELAEEIYEIAINIDGNAGNVRPAQFVLRGESLFWMKKFDLAQRMFHYALNASGQSVDPLPDTLAAVASIRTADAWLAQVDFDKVEKTKKDLKESEQGLRKAQRGRKEYFESLARVNQLKLELEKISKPLVKATVGYSRHIAEFPEDHTADHARIRLACLNLPEYLGNNIVHARALLEDLKQGIRGKSPSLKESLPKNEGDGSEKEKKEAGDTEAPAAGEPKDEEVKEESIQEEGEVKKEEKKDSAKAIADEEILEDESWEFAKDIKYKSGSKYPALPEPAIHLAWGCQTASFAQHERSLKMIKKVKNFSNLYPQSRYLRGMVEPVRETQASRIYDYLKNGKYYEAINFFEQNRKVLFRDIPNRLRVELFKIYVQIHQSIRAKEFLSTYKTVSKSDLDEIRLAVYSSETASETGINSDINESMSIGKRLVGRKWTVEDEPAVRLYIDRLRNSKYFSHHSNWIMEIGERWAEKDAKVVCEVHFPILSKLWREDPGKRQWVKDYSKKIFSQHLNEILQFETFCGYSLLEFEYLLFSDDPKYLAQKYAERDFLIVNSVTGNLMWNLSELLLARGNREDAVQLWERLESSGEDDVKEVEFARSRLDNRRTELDNLWE